MLVLTRKIGQQVNIGDDIVVKVLEIGRDRIRLGFECPIQVRVLRDELFAHEGISGSQKTRRTMPPQSSACRSNRFIRHRRLECRGAK